MMKKYGVYGMMEWQGPFVGGRVRLTFSGGDMSGYGMRPATYQTDNPAIQAIIEKSEWFLSGFIKRCDDY